MGTKWDWDEDDIKYLYLECGWTAKDLSVEWGIPYISVVRKIRQMGIGRGRGTFEREPKVYPPELVEQVRVLYLEQHMTQLEVANAISATTGTKISMHVVQRVMVSAGIKARPPANRGGVRDQTGEKNPAWRGGPGVRPCDRK